MSENVEPKSNHSSSSTQVNDERAPSHSRISFSASIDQENDILIVDSTLRKRSMDIVDESNGSKKKKNRQLEDVNLKRDRFGHPDETDDSDEERTRKRVAAPSFTGHRVLTTHGKDANSTIRTNHQLFVDFQFQQNKLEKRFFQPLLVSIKRQSEALKEIIITQTKIIRRLRRRQVSF